MPSGVPLTQASAPASFAFTSQVAASDTVVIGDQTYTFEASPAAANDVDIGADLDGSISNLVAAINDSGVEGTDYGTGTVANPYVTAAADLVNDEVDLTARGAGSQYNGLHLAATSPGANDITANGVTLAAVTGATAGVGVLDDFVSDLIDQSQINSDVLLHLKQLTDAAD